MPVHSVESIQRPIAVKSLLKHWYIYLEVKRTLLSKRVLILLFVQALQDNSNYDSLYILRGNIFVVSEIIKIKKN